MRKSKSTPCLYSSNVKMVPKLKTIYNQNSNNLSIHTNAFDMNVAMNTPLPNLITCNIEHIGEQLISEKMKMKTTNSVEKNEKNDDIRDLALCLSTPPDVKDFTEETSNENEKNDLFSFKRRRIIRKKINLDNFTPSSI